MTATIQSPPRRSIHRPCAVCGLRTDMLLCRECADQPAASKARVLAWLSANDDQHDAAFDAWDRLCRTHMDAWEKIRAAQALPDYAARCARHRAAGNVYGVLLQARDDYELALQPLDSERRRLERALQILESLNGAPLATCKDCSIHFEDLNGHKLCDGCLCEYINGAGILELDDE